MNNKAYTVTVTEVLPHPNADRLVLAKVLGFTTVISKDSFKAGDTAIFIETDAVLTPQLEHKILGNSKIHLENGRVRAAKIRGVVSEGILVSPLLLTQEEIDSGVSKYDPPARTAVTPAAAVAVIPRYIDTVRLEKVPGIFSDSDIVHVTAKLHGTSVRYGWAKLPPNEMFICGTRNMDIGTPQIYHDVAAKEHLAEKLKKLPGVVLFGEIIGPGIQKHYDYGCDSPKLYLYAAMRDGKYLDYLEFRQLAEQLSLNVVPLLRLGKWGDIRGELSTLLDITSYPTQVETGGGCPCREGLVIGTMAERQHPLTGPRTIVKYINPEYLLNRGNSDEH